MKIKIQITIEHEPDQPADTHELLTIERDKLTEETLGLTLSEAKRLLSGVQENVVAAQCEAQLLQHRLCPHCGKRQLVKDRREFDIRTLFGRHTIKSPRLIRCACKEVKAATFSPLAELLPGRTTPELLYIEAKFASLVSYGATIDFLSTLLPVDDAVSTSSLHRHVRDLGERIESEMGDEQKMFTACSQREMDELPVAGDRLYVSFDGGYVRARSKEKRQDGSMEIITGQCSKSDGTMRRFASVQKYDTKPKRRIYDMMTAQGMQPNQEVTFLTDGGDTLRRLAEYVNPYAERVLDWFHVTMRITQLGQMAKGIPPSEDLTSENLAKNLERIKWKLWHGNTDHAIPEIDGLVFDLDSYDIGDNHDAQMPESVRKMHRAMCEFSTYIKLNRKSIPNYGDRYRNAEPISSAIAESMVNQVISKRMCKQQQMRWTPAGAHRLLQIRVKTLDGELFNTFKKWYPAMTDSFV